MVVSSVQNSLMLGGYRDHDLKVNISGGGDVSCYPHLLEVASAFNQLESSYSFGLY